eukprot:CAMPEP_0198228664 /NCGR_PEP_ID=MMETSP1445-20131203/113713_1 /TAXON_ID=36898 /ORGANISM="Pyramimonas sp., Strain CCMP2087" /LENGTH=198 /DNA_ID=CAMNT_0043909079 /DNA_START=1527 /DNA_END=2120 /DNA_ORIENTATION=+
MFKLEEFFDEWEQERVSNLARANTQPVVEADPGAHQQGSLDEEMRDQDQEGEEDSRMDVEDQEQEDTADEEDSKTTTALSHGDEDDSHCSSYGHKDRVSDPRPATALISSASSTPTPMTPSTPSLPTPASGCTTRTPATPTSPAEVNKELLQLRQHARFAELFAINEDDDFAKLNLPAIISVFHEACPTMWDMLTKAA